MNHWQASLNGKIRETCLRTSKMPGISTILTFFTEEKKKKSHVIKCVDWFDVVFVYTFFKSLLGNFNPRKRSCSPWPNFCKPENVQSAANCVPSNTCSVSPCIRILKYGSDGSAPNDSQKMKNYFNFLHILKFRFQPVLSEKSVYSLSVR